jgi:hypothetical protein
MSSTTTVVKTNQGKKRKTSSSSYSKTRKSFQKKVDKGQLQLNRKGDELTCYNNIPEAGGIGIYPAAQTVLSLGTPVVNGSGSYDIPFAMLFRLDQLAEYSDITSLCDKYRLDKVKVELYYQSVINDQLGGASDITMPYIEWVEDNDDNNLMASNAFRAKMGIKTAAFKGAARVATLWAKPKLSQMIWSSSLTTAYEVPTRPLWVDSSYPSVPHYGIKGFIRGMLLPAASSSYNGMKNSIKWNVTYTVSGKDFQ